MVPIQIDPSIIPPFSQNMKILTLCFIYIVASIPKNESLETDNITIYFNTMKSNRTIFQMAVNPSDTVRSVKHGILEKTDYNFDEMSLIFNATLLKNNMILSQFEIKQDSIIFIQSLSQILIENNGKYSALIIDTLQSIKDLRSTISTMQSIPLNQLRLVFEGKQLYDRFLLDDYNVCKDSIIHLFIRMN
jgi:hypothetical protein